MTSVEKRRSGRKSGMHRKHSDGGYSDTSSGGSFLDETDREVSNLTDRAFRSLCIGDEAVYNDSDLCSSPCTQRDRQLAFTQSGPGRDREELKRAAHESFSLRVQQYGQDWNHGGMYEPEIHRDSQLEVYGQKTQGRVSATFQHAFVETSQQEKSLREEHLSFLSNGATELSLQQRRSRSRVSSLIRAFNSEGHRDNTGMDSKLREWNDETSWDKSALMSIQRELSEFSCQQNFNNGHFPPAGPFSTRDTNFYSSEVAAVTHMNSASPFMRSYHSKHSLSAQVNCNSNFFIHSEFSPFKAWRDHNRFPFQQGEVSGFMHCSEFPKWYETPMYKELSLETQPQGPYRFDERGIRHPRNNLMSVVHPTLPRSTSTSTMLQKTSAVEKRCESELASHYPHRKRTQSLGTNRLSSQCPSTESPRTKMSQRVQDTISSVEALRQKIQMMTEQNMTTGMTANQQGVICSNDNVIPFGSTALAVAPNVVTSKSSTTPFNISQLHTPVVHAHQEAETSEVSQYAGSPQPVEHPPVRAESRGAMLEVRMSSYKSRATSLLFNLKDNRKRVKSTYSPTKFKGLDTLENKQPSIQEPRDTVIDIPDFPDSNIQFAQIEESSRINVSHQSINQYHSSGLSLTTLNSQPAMHTGQNSEYTLSDFHTAQTQGEMAHHSGFTGLKPENYTSNQLANGQNLHEDFSSFTPYKQGLIDHVKPLGENADSLKSSYTPTDTQRVNVENNQTREYLISESNIEQNFNETVGREFTKVDTYQQFKDNKHDYNSEPSQDRWRQTNCQDTENLSLKAAISPWKQEITALIEKDQYAQAYPGAAVIMEEVNLSRDKYKGENKQHIDKPEKTELRESFDVETVSHKKTGLVNANISNQLPKYAAVCNDAVENQAKYEQQQPGAFRDKHQHQTYFGHSEENEVKENYLTQNYNRYTDQYRNQHNLYSNKDKTMLTQETAQRQQHTPIPKEHEMESLWSIEPKPQFQHNTQKNSLSHTDNLSISTIANQVRNRKFAEVKAEQATAEHISAEAELAKAQPRAQVEQPKVDSARLILAGQTGSEKVNAEQTKAELTEHKQVKQAKAEHMKEEQQTEEQTQQPREKQPLQARVKKAAEDPSITEEAGAVLVNKEEGEQVKAEQAEAERENIKNGLVKREQPGKARTQQAEQTTRDRVKAEQVKKKRVRAEPAERECKEAAQIKTEHVKAEQVDVECKTAEQTREEQINEQQNRAERARTKVTEVGKVKVEDVRQEKTEEYSMEAGQVNAEQVTTQINKALEAKVKEGKGEKSKLEQPKVEMANSDLIKTKYMQERSAKLAAKLTMTQKVKSEPDKVEQVKTELAKTKAELAKIKEKMKGEQKEKARNVGLMKEDNITNVDIISTFNNNNKNEDYNKTNQAIQVHQQKGESVVCRNSRDQADRGVGDYDCLREKYGFTSGISTNKNKVSAAENHSSHYSKDTPALSFDKVETMNNEKSKDEHSPTRGFMMANVENKEMTESHYVYSESSKEFKLTSANDLVVDSVPDKVKDISVEKFQQTNVSKQRDSDLAKPPSLERKPKPTEHSAGSAKDSRFTPLRALPHKERAQTKQEILTSKIKAHAEKEISAIKEKGFAIRDGFISKNSTKQLASSQSYRLRPASQEVSKKYGSTASSNSTPKHQMEPSGIQMAPLKSVSPLSSVEIPVKSVKVTSQLTDQPQKQAPKEPEKSNDSVLEPPTEAKQMGNCSMCTDEGLVEIQKKGNIEANREENYGNQKRGLKANPAVNNDHLNSKKEDPVQDTALVEAESSSPMITHKAEIKHEAVLEDSAPSLNLLFAQNESPAVEDSLQITGIMVIVRERKSSLNNDVEDNSTQQHMNTKGKECNNSDKSHLSSGFEACKGNTSLMEASIADTIVQETHPTLNNVGMNNHPENVHETSALETKKNIVSENITEKTPNIQQESCINAKPQRETQLQEPLTEKDIPTTVTVPAKNKGLAETQPILCKQEIIAGEHVDHTNKMPKENSATSTRKDKLESKTGEENPHKKKSPDTNENFMAKVVNATINGMNETNRADTETLTKQDDQLSFKEDITTVMEPFNSSNIDGNSAPLLEEKRHDSPPAKPFNKINPSNRLNDKENIHVSPEETIPAENNRVDDNVHIDRIAVRVVPAVTGKDLITVTSDAVTADEHKRSDTSSYKEKVNTSNNEVKTQDVTPASTQKHMQESPEDKSGVQYVLSSVRKLSDLLKINNQQNSINATNTKAEDKKSKNIKKSGTSVDESSIETMEQDYFQVQGLKETNNEAYNTVNVGDMSDGVLKAGEAPNKPAISNESYKEGRNEVLDQSKRKTVETIKTESSVQNENMKRKNSETQDRWASKQSDGPTEGQSNNEKLEANQIRKHHTESQSSLATRERQRSRNSYPTRESAVKEKPDVKPKERVSTIPEISAIADYARLKVIVSEDRANTIQEFAPNKKEGFFPLIQTRHSRRPESTADTKDLSVKDKSLPSKTEVSANVNKEPKALVFPFTDKEHQRTGMFKLGDKERLLDVKSNDKHTQQQRNKSPNAQTEQVAGAGTQRESQEDQSILHYSNQLSQTTSAVNRPKNTSEGLTYLDKYSHPQLPLGQIPNMGEIMTTQRKEQKIEKQKDKGTEAEIENGRTDKLKQERFPSWQEETKTKQQSKAKQLEEELDSGIEEQKRAENIRIKHLIVESRASLAEEEKKSAQREEERRAREREAIAINIKERQGQLREAERRAQEERKAKQIEGARSVHKEEDSRERQREEERRMKEAEEKTRVKIEKERRAKLKGEEAQVKENEERSLKEQEEDRAAQEERQRTAAVEEQQRRTAQEQQQQRRAAQEEQQRRAAQEEQQRRAAIEEQQKRTAQEQQQQRRAAQEEQERRAAQEEQQRRAAQEEQQRRAAIEEQQKRTAQEQQQQRRAAQEEQERRAAQEEQQRRAAQEEQQRRTAQEQQQQRRAAQEEQQRRAAQEEQQRRAAQEEQQKRTAQEEQKRRAAQEEQQRRAAIEEQQKRTAQEQQQQRRAAQEEQQRRAAIEEQQKRTAQEQQQQRRAAQEEQQRRAAQEEKQRRAAQEEQQRRAAIEEQQKRTAQEQQQQRRAAQEEQQRRAAIEEQQKRTAQEQQQQRRAAQEEQQRRAAIEEQQKRTAQEQQQQRRAAQEEQQRRAAQEEQQRRAAQEEKQRRAAQEEQQKRTAQEEQQKRAAQEEQQRRAAQEEQQKRTAQEEQQKRAAQEEQQRRAAQEEQQKRTAQEQQQQRRAAQEEKQRRTAQEQQQQRRAAQEEKQRRAAQEEQQRRAAQEEQQKRTAQEEQQKRAAQEEQQRRAAQEEQQRRAAPIDEQRQAKQTEEKMLAEEEKKRKCIDSGAAQKSEEERLKQIQEQKRTKQQSEALRRERQWLRTQREAEEKKAEKEVAFIQQKEEKQAKTERTSLFEEKRVPQEQMLAQREDGIIAKKREEDEKLAPHREMEKGPETEEQKRGAQMMDAIQYYAITSTESEQKYRERQLCSPLPSQKRNNSSRIERTEDSGSHTTAFRPHASASPAPSLPRSNTSSPALGAKPLMFRVKDNTIRGSSFTKSVKPRFHKNFGVDFRMGSPIERGLERREEEQEILRRSAVTPVHSDTGSNRLATIKESSTFQPLSSSQDFPAPLAQHRPYSRKSTALEVEDDSRSVISNMSEDVESFATGATDLADVRGLYDYDRPESACSFSSDVSRTLGKPPVVPPKSEKALQRAKRLTSRRIKKESSKAVVDHPGGIKKPPQEVSSLPSTSSTEVQSSNHHCVASPHFSPPVSLAHAPTLESGLPSSHKEQQSSQHSVHASPRVTGPISLPFVMPHATAPVSLPVAPSHATGTGSHTAAPNTVAHVPSSPTLHHGNHPAPVTQYHVESSYPQSYPLTQRKVLQDLGSGQYYVVDVPVQVKTKTFFDPETGKYVQLNVRESSQSTPRSQPQQTYTQPHLQPQMQVKVQQQPLSQTSTAGNLLYHGYLQGYQPINSVTPHRSSATVSLHQDQQPVRENHSYGYPAPEMGQISEGRYYSPEKTPYMDTVNDTEKTYNRVYNTHGSQESFPECDTNSQLARSSVCENDNSAHSQYRRRDIITMSELEDFMEVSDW